MQEMSESTESKVESAPPTLQADAFIAGGGPVGLMLAIGLALKGFKVVLAEQYEPVAGAQNSFDGRVLALSHGSMQVLAQLGIWQDLIAFTTEIRHVHVSQKGYLGLTTLHAEEVGVPALGYSIQSSDLGRVLWSHARALSNIEMLCPASLATFTQDENQVVAKVEMSAGLDEVSVPTAQPVSCYVQAKLMVGADGTQSQVRKVLALPIEEKSYHAYGVIAQIETEEHPNHWAFERFTQDGPVALLPMQGHFHKAVLVCPAQEIEQVKALDDQAFLDLFARKMGERLGAFTWVSPRVIYPLKETYVAQMAKGRALLMGNASHTQHPVAAQGLNLGIRDIEVFLAQCEAGSDIGNAQSLLDYAQLRRADHENVMGLTDSLIEIFQHKSPVVGHLRGLGLMTLQALPSLKRRFSKFAMQGRQA